LTSEFGLAIHHYAIITAITRPPHIGNKSDVRRHAAYIGLQSVRRDVKIRGIMKYTLLRDSIQDITKNGESATPSKERSPVLQGSVATDFRLWQIQYAYLPLIFARKEL